MYNLHTYKTEFKAIVGGGSWGNKSFSAAFLPDSRIIRYVNDALRKIYKDFPMREPSQTVNLASQMSHQLAEGVVLDELHRVEILGSSGTDFTPLDRLTYEEFNDKYDIDDPGTGGPVHWTSSQTDRRTILIGPIPNYTRTNGLSVTGRAFVSPVRRIYQQTTITASVAYGNSEVTLSADPNSSAAGSVLDEDDFGVIESTQVDGETVTDDDPRAWQLIQDITTTVITLSGPYLGPTNAAQKFITAQVPEAELYFPDSIGFAPVYSAASLFFMPSDMQRAETLKNIADGLLQGAERQESGAKLASRRPPF